MADRTDEFFSLARAVPATGAMSSIRVGGASSDMQQRQPGDMQHNKPQQQQQQQNPALAELRSFRSAAAEISHDVSTTSSLLAELSRLVKTGAGGTRMFADEAANEHADAIVLRIKSNIEALHSRLEEASVTLDRSRRRLGKNSQAGEEASNLVGQLKEEFVKTTSGFKAVLEERSDGMKDTNDRKRRVVGGSFTMGSDEGTAPGEGERVDLTTLMNKPAVYGGEQRSASFGGEGMSGGMGGGLGSGGLGGGGNRGMPSLDLTSGMMAMAQRHQEEVGGGLPAGESSSQLPRPREFDVLIFAFYH